MPSPSNSAALIIFKPPTGTALVKRSEDRESEKSWALSFSGFTLSPGRTLYRVYTVWGHALEKKANRVAHKIGMGSNAAAQKLKAYFGDGEQRLLKLEGLRTCTPAKVRDYCADLVKYTLPTEAPTNQLHAFKNVVYVCTRFHGLRTIFLGCKAMQGATSAASIYKLWDPPPGLAPPSEERLFWQGLAVACLSDTTITTLVLENTPVAQLTHCPEEGLSVIERLLVEWDCSADSKYSAALCVRYLGGILDLPGFWAEMGTVQSLVAKKLCCEMVRALKDIGVDVLQLGSVQDDDDPPFDYDGLDFLAATMLVAFSRWFQKLDEQDRAHQPWYDPLREILQLLRAPRSVDLLPMANGCAIGIWSVLLPLRWKSVELNVTAICKDGDGLSDTQNMSDPPRDDPPLASVTGALLEDDQSEAESSDEANPSNSEDSRSTESTEVNDAPKDELEIDPATAPPEKPNARKRGRIWRGLRRTWKDSFQKSRLRTGSDDVSDGKATSDPTRENFGGHEDRLNSVPKHGDAEDDEEGGEDNLSAEKSDVQLGSDTASTRDPSTETASEKHDRLQHPSNPEDEENNSSVNDGNTRAHPVGIVNPHNSRDIEVNTIFDSSGLNVVPSQPPAQQPTCTNLRIRSADDANKILFAVHCNILHPVTRRLDRDERAAIRAGCVFAWEERSYDNQIGIERFTDSKRWSPSRTWNEFLFYYQRWGPDPNQPEVTEPPPGWVPLIKQTYSVWVQTERGRRKWHLTAYLTQATVGHLGTVDYSAYDRLGTLDDMPDVRSLEVPPHVFRSTRRRRNPDPDPATTAGAPISAAFPAPITPHLEASNSPAFSAIQSTQTQRPRSPGPHRGAGEP